MSHCRPRGLSIAPSRKISPHEPSRARPFITHLQSPTTTVEIVTRIDAIAMSSKFAAIGGSELRRVPKLETLL